MSIHLHVLNCLHIYKKSLLVVSTLLFIRVYFVQSTIKSLWFIWAPFNVFLSLHFVNKGGDLAHFAVCTRHNGFRKAICIDMHKRRSTCKYADSSLAHTNLIPLSILHKDLDILYYW